MNSVLFSQYGDDLIGDLADFADVASAANDPAAASGVSPLPSVSTSPVASPAAAASLSSTGVVPWPSLVSKPVSAASRRCGVLPSSSMALAVLPALAVSVPHHTGIRIGRGGIVISGGSGTRPSGDGIFRPSDGGGIGGGGGEIGTSIDATRPSGGGMFRPSGGGIGGGGAG